LRPEKNFCPDSFQGEHLLPKTKTKQSASEKKTAPEELFEWVEPPAASLKTKNNLSLTSPLRTLKTIIWSIDWEISDQILLMLNEELNQLKQYYQEDETVIKFLLLMEAVGRYITKRQGKSHPESVRLLREFFVELERIVFTMGLSEVERKASLQKQIDKFNALKKKLASSRATEVASEEPAPKTGAPPKKAPSKKKPPEAKTTPPEPEEQPLSAAGRQAVLNGPMEERFFWTK
jgi:hypothetical protein